MYSEDKTQISKLILYSLGFKPSNRSNFYHCKYHKDNTASLSVDLPSSRFHCFSCSKSGSLLKLFYEEKGENPYRYFNLDQPNHRKFSDESFNLPLGSLSEKEIQPLRVSLKITGKSSDATKHLGVLDFFKIRGFPIEFIKRYKMSWAEEIEIIDNLYEEKNRTLEESTMKIFERLAIPIEENGNLINIEYRDVYFNRKNLPKSKYRKVLYPKGASLSTLFEYDLLNKKEPLYLVEGLMDLFSLRTHKDFQNSTTVFGASICSRQYKMLNEFEEIIYIRNNDEAGKESLHKLECNFKGKLWCLLPPKNCKDVGEIIDSRFGGSTIQTEIEKGWLRRKALIEKEEKKKRKIQPENGFPE